MNGQFITEEIVNEIENSRIQGKYINKTNIAFGIQQEK